MDGHHQHRGLNVTGGSNCSPARDERMIWQREESPKDAADRHAEKLIIDAEKFKATITTPHTGKDSLQEQELQANQLQKILNFIDNTQDEEFYHITCHIDQNLSKKL